MLFWFEFIYDACVCLSASFKRGWSSTYLDHFYKYLQLEANVEASRKRVGTE